MALRREQADGDDHGGDEVGEGAEDPHEDCAENLIVEDGETEGVGVGDVERVDGAVAEGEEAGEHRHHDVCKGEVEEDAPVVGAFLRGPGTEDHPPEEQGRDEEGEVLGCVEGLVF